MILDNYHQNIQLILSSGGDEGRSAFRQVMIMTTTLSFMTMMMMMVMKEKMIMLMLATINIVFPGAARQAQDVSKVD